MSRPFRFPVASVVLITLGLTVALMPGNAACADDAQEWKKKFEKLEKEFAASEAALKEVFKQTEALKAALEKRDQAIQFLEQELKKSEQEKKRASAEKDALLGRMEQLLKTVKELHKKIAELQAGGPKPMDKKPAANPPAAFIKGTIEKVVPGANTVQVSLGSDHGLQVGHTLEVFRMQPAPKYLGMIRIIEVTSTKSIGQLVPNPGAPATELKVGDSVASQIQP